MYRPAAFTCDDHATLAALIGAHPLGTLVRQDEAGQLQADALPLLLETEAGDTWLRGHVARANPLWRQADGREVLLLFHGPQGHVSPSWYPGKALDPRVVPTWNYSLVQARGTLRAIDDRAWLRALVTRLTERHESQAGSAWRVDDAPADYLARMLGAIVGIEIKVEQLQGKLKQGQNRSAADRAGVVEGLRAQGRHTLAQAVQATLLSADESPPPGAQAP